MKRSAQILIEFARRANLEKDIEKANGETSVFLGGTTEDNEWRKKIKKEFANKIKFLDPYDDDWEPTENIYDECSAMLAANYIIFYKGGKLSKKEQTFLKDLGRKFKTFDDITQLKKYLNIIEQISDEYDRFEQLSKKEDAA